MVKAAVCLEPPVCFFSGIRPMGAGSLNEANNRQEIIFDVQAI